MDASQVRSNRINDYAETQVSGRVSGPMIRKMIADYERLGGGAVWSIRAGDATAYTVDAMQEAIKGFSRLAKDRGLRRIVALITSSTVRMGASVVSMSLRAAGSPMEIRVVKDALEARSAVAEPLD